MTPIRTKQKSNEYFIWIFEINFFDDDANILSKCVRVENDQRLTQIDDIKES